MLSHSSKTRKRRIMFSSRCAVCNSKNIRCTKEYKAGVLLRSLRVKTSLSQIPLASPILF